MFNRGGIDALTIKRPGGRRGDFMQELKTARGASSHPKERKIIHQEFNGSSGGHAGSTADEPGECRANVARAMPEFSLFDIPRLGDASDLKTMCLPVLARFERYDRKVRIPMLTNPGACRITLSEGARKIDFKRTGIPGDNFLDRGSPGVWKVAKIFLCIEGDRSGGLWNGLPQISFKMQNVVAFRSTLKQDGLSARNWRDGEAADRFPVFVEKLQSEKNREIPFGFLHEDLQDIGLLRIHPGQFGRDRPCLTHIELRAALASPAAAEDHHGCQAEGEQRPGGGLGDDSDVERSGCAIHVEGADCVPGTEVVPGEVS